MIGSALGWLVVAGVVYLFPAQPPEATRMSDEKRAEVPAPEDRTPLVRRAMGERGWPDGKVGVSRQRPDLGAWQVYQAFPLAPDTGKVQVRVWVGPDGAVIVAGEPLARARLRAVVDQPFVDLRRAAEVAALTAGARRGVTSVMTGDPMETYPQQSPAKAATVEGAAGHRRLHFWARAGNGGPLGLAAALDGDGNVTLTELPGQP